MVVAVQGAPVHDHFHVPSQMSAFRLRPGNDIFSNGQDAYVSLLVVVLVGRLGGTTGEGILSTHIDLRYFKLQSPTPHGRHLGRLPPPLDSVKDLPSKTLEDLHRVLYEYCTGRETGSQSLYWAPIS